MTGEVETLKLCRNENIPWGFRLQGGKDFGTLLTIQKVNPNSLAHNAGVVEGDAVLQIMGHETDTMRHKEAQDAIIRAGNYLEITVQRGGSNLTKPRIPINKPLPTSQKAPQAPPSSDTVTALVHKQFNSPAPMYSMDNIAETLSAHTEILAGGIKGINFMKPDKPVNKMSPVCQMIMEEESMKVEKSSSTFSSTTVSSFRQSEVSMTKVTQQQQQQQQQQQIPKVPAPIAKPAPPAPKPQLPVAKPAPPMPEKPAESVAAQGACAECGRAIVGVFVRVHDRSLHEECFRCSTCGTSLKNVGYININQKLYCDIHAKQAAQVIAPEGEPISVMPGITPQALGTPTSFLRNVSPIPFQTHKPAPPAVHPQTAPVAAAPQSAASSRLGQSLISTDMYRQLHGFTPLRQPVADQSEPKLTGTAPPSGAHSGASSRPAPRRGRGQLKQEAGPGSRIPVCAVCEKSIRGPFVTALGKTWCPDHFHCNNNHCKQPLQDIGFVEEQGQLYCETCYEKFLAPICNKCNIRIKGDCLIALDKQWHPECFTCAYCSKPFGNSSFYLEDGLPYCEKDWNELFTTKCVGCGFPIEAGDRWVEALNNNYHSQCFKCSICNKNLEGQSFFAKGGRPFCKAHAR